MKLIPLSSTKRRKNYGKYFAQVDDEDYEYLMQWKWSAHIAKHTIYANRRLDKLERLNTKATAIMMHRLLISITEKELFVDHIDHNGLNCQRSNLRIATRSQNNTNRVSKKKGTSKFLGVHLSKRVGTYKNKKYFYPDKYIAQIKVDGRQVHLGIFKTEIEAAQVYDEAAKKYFGEWANPNFK